MAELSVEFSYQVYIFTHYLMENKKGHPTIKFIDKFNDNPMIMIVIFSYVFGRVYFTKYPGQIIIYYIFFTIN